MTTKQYKQLKGLKKQNLRDNMSTAEIVLNMLAEVATTELSKGQQPEGFAENKEVARRGGKIAGQAREAIEVDSGQPLSRLPGCPRHYHPDIPHGGASRSQAEIPADLPAI